MLLILLSANGFLRAQSVEDTLIYEEVEEEAVFSYGRSALLKYISTHLELPETFHETSQGKILISFVVEKDGSLSHLMLQRGTDNLDHDAKMLQMISAMPPWTPAKIGGKSVRCSYSLPIYICFK